jgi:hypothetical protein
MLTLRNATQHRCHGWGTAIDKVLHLARARTQLCTRSSPSRSARVIPLCFVLFVFWSAGCATLLNVPQEVSLQASHNLITEAGNRV